MCPPLQYFTECFHCRENLKLCLFIPYFPLTLGNIDVCLLSCKSPRPFLEYHMVGIIQSMPFILASFISERVLKNKLQKSFTVEKKYRVVDGEYHSLSREITWEATRVDQGYISGHEDSRVFLEEAEELRGILWVLAWAAGWLVAPHSKPEKASEGSREAGECVSLGDVAVMWLGGIQTEIVRSEDSLNLRFQMSLMYANEGYGHG